MPSITITVPAAKVDAIADAVAARYGEPATAAGVRAHLIAHLRDTVQAYQKEQAQRAAGPDYNDGSWGSDLSEGV